MMNILITGATGFIGSSIIKKLHHKYCFHALVRPGTDSTLFDELGIKTIIDRKNYQELAQEFKEYKIEGILHLASLFIKDHKRDEINSLIQSNIGFGTNLLDICRECEIKWFINTGTFWQHYNNEGYNPANLYAATKQAFLNLARFYTETTDLKFVSLELNDTYGPGDSRPKILNLLKRVADSGEEFDMSGGEQLMDICHIDDVVMAFDSLIDQIESPLVTNESSYSLYAKERMTLKDLVSLFEEVYGKKLNINFGSLPYREREVMIPWNKGKSLPNFTPKKCLKEGLEELLD